MRDDQVSASSIQVVLTGVPPVGVEPRWPAVEYQHGSAVPTKHYGVGDRDGPPVDSVPDPGDHANEDQVRAPRTLGDYELSVHHLSHPTAVRR